MPHSVTRRYVNVLVTTSRRALYTQAFAAKRAAKRSVYGFSQGDRGAVSTSSMLHALDPSTEVLAVDAVTVPDHVVKIPATCFRTPRGPCPHHASLALRNGAFRRHELSSAPDRSLIRVDNFHNLSDCQRLRRTFASERTPLR